MIHIDRVFIVHYAPLENRRKILTQMLEANLIQNYEFITNYDRNSTPKEIMDLYYTLGQLTPAQICIGISHLEIFKTILQNGYQNVLILEDDAVLDNTFSIKLNSYLETLPADYEVAFLNNGCSQHVRNAISGKVWYRVDAGRTLCGYIVTPSFCKKLIASSIPYTEVIDWEISSQIKKQQITCYWAEPTIVRDGSADLYGSSYTRFIDLPK